MSEALLKSSHGKFYDVYSAGSNPTNVNPHAIIVMSEIDIDISTNRSNKFEYFWNLQIWLCGHFMRRWVGMSPFHGRKNLSPQII